MSDRAEVGAGVADVDLAGTTVLVTGSTGGIGRETALSLGRLGATALVHGRDEDRGRAVVEELESLGVDAEFFRADFASLAAVRDLAGRIREAAGTLDVLVNNAGGVFRRPELTEDGVEKTFAVNHLAPFLLTNLLLPSMPDDGRVVTVASGAHERARIDFESIRSLPGDYSSFDAYGRSKLANVLFARELARRLDERGSAITSNSLHPGAVPGSGIAREYPVPVRAGVKAIEAIPGMRGLLFATETQGAETSVYLAASPEVADVSGAYFGDCERKTPAAAARDERTARRLWEFSADLAGIDPELDLGE